MRLLQVSPHAGTASRRYRLTQDRLLEMSGPAGTPGEHGRHATPVLDSERPRPCPGACRRPRHRPRRCRRTGAPGGARTVERSRAPARPAGHPSGALPAGRSRRRAGGRGARARGGRDGGSRTQTSVRPPDPDRCLQDGRGLRGGVGGVPCRWRDAPRPRRAVAGPGRGRGRPSCGHPDPRAGSRPPPGGDARADFLPPCSAS